MKLLWTTIALYLLTGLVMLWGAWLRDALGGLGRLERCVGVGFYVLLWPAVMGFWFVGGIVALADAIAERFMR